MMRMFGIVAIEAQQFPVTAVGRVIVVIMIAVMHRESRQIRAAEFPAAAAAYPRIQLQRLLAVRMFAQFPLAPGGGNDLIEPVFAPWLQNHEIPAPIRLPNSSTLLASMPIPNPRPRLPASAT